MLHAIISKTLKLKHIFPNDVLLQTDLMADNIFFYVNDMLLHEEEQSFQLISLKFI